MAQGGFGKFYHNRELTPIDNRIVQRPNRDTLYSTGVFDLDAGPVTITLPDAGKRFMTMIVIDEDHYVFTVVYGAGRYTLTKAKIGTRYAVAAIRILVDPSDPKDVDAGQRPAGCRQGRAAGRPGQIRDAELGRSQPEEGARCAGGAGRNHS